MITVFLHGYLGKQFSKEGIEIETTELSTIVQLLISRFGNDFRNTLEVGEWHLITGAKDSEEVSEEDQFLNEKFLELPIFENELHIFPAIYGAGGRGIGQIILGVVLIVIAVVAAYFTGGASLAAIPGASGTGIAAGFAASSLAASLALAGAMSIAGGIMSMLTKTPNMGNYDNAGPADQRQSFIFNGPVNSSEQGGPIPVVCGRHLTGSTVVYAGMDVEQL
jgi:predicted phage tail protein